MKKFLVLFLLIGSLILGNVYPVLSQVNTYPTLKITGIVLTATDNVAVTGYLINESPVTPSPNAVGWVSTPPTTYTFATEGTKTLYAWVKDAAGNVSDSKSITLIIQLPDITKPVITNFNIPAVSASLNVPIKSFKAEDDNKVVGFKLTETAFLNTNENWQLFVPKSYTFNSIGNKTLYAWVKDESGNVSASVSDKVIIRKRFFKSFKN